jgi:hypothetical protein
LFYCISLLLVPGSLLHAHVDVHDPGHAHSHEDVQVHGGHDHQFAGFHVDTDKHQDSTHDDHVVKLDSSPEHGASTLLWAWVALPIVFLVLFICLPLIGFASRRQRREPRIPKQFPPWPPPLRGPPISI